MGSMGEPEIPYVDALIVGAGFGAFTVLNKLRRLGLSVTIYEKGSASGGIWYWNCYPVSQALGYNVRTSQVLAGKAIRVRHALTCIDMLGRSR